MSEFLVPGQLVLTKRSALAYRMPYKEVVDRLADTKNLNGHKTVVDSIVRFPTIEIATIIAIFPGANFVEIAHPKYGIVSIERVSLVPCETYLLT